MKQRSKNPASSTPAAVDREPSPPAVATAAVSTAGGPARDWQALLTQPVDGASLAIFRMAFGLLMAWDLAFYAFDGRIERFYLGPLVHFKYPFFAWVEAAPAGVMQGLVVAAMAAALAFAAGFFFRVAAAILCGVLVYLYLLEVTAYNNHNYLFCLLAFLCLLLPMQRVAAVDARHHRAARGLVPAWSVWLLRFQVGVPYFFGGVAKLNYDWLVRAQPMTQWLRTDNLGGSLKLEFFQASWAGYFFSWTGALFDLLIVPALIWRKTRLPAYLLLLVFNLANAFIFDIGVFPWAMILLSTIYFEPDWPRRLGLIPPPRHEAAAQSAKKAVSEAQVAPLPWRICRWLLAAWVLWQVLMPFRGLFYPGNIDWTEETHRYSWRMKIRDKQGEVKFVMVEKASGRQVPLDHADDLLTQRQQRYVYQDPELIRQMAHFIADGLRAKGYKDFEIRAVSSVSLNERPAQPLIDPEFDLAAEPASLAPKKWIVPLRPL